MPSLCCFGGILRHHLSILMALSATMAFFRSFEWGRFLPSLCCFDGAFRPHFCILTALFAPTLFSSDLSVALFAPIFTFWGHFLPPFSYFGGAFCPHTGFAYSVVSFSIASASDITFSAISASASINPFVSGCISTSSCSLITEFPSAAS